MRQQNMHDKHEFGARSYNFVEPINDRYCNECVISEHCKYWSANI